MFGARHSTNIAIFQQLSGQMLTRCSSQDVPSAGRRLIGKIAVACFWLPGISSTPCRTQFWGKRLQISPDKSSARGSIRLFYFRVVLPGFTFVFSLTSCTRNRTILRISPYGIASSSGNCTDPFAFL